MGKIFFTILILFITSSATYSALKGGVDYKLPIDYTKLNIAETESKAEIYYNAALKSKKLDENMTSALNAYTMLTNACPENIIYPLRLGKLYDVLGKDRYAKGNYFFAMNINKSRPEPYFYLGGYYYEREQYRKALKFYLRAYDNGYSEHYQTLRKLGDIYQKLGDTEKSLQYLQCALTIAPDRDLEEQLSKVKNADSANKEYYRK